MIIATNRSLYCRRDGFSFVRSFVRSFVGHLLIILAIFGMIFDYFSEKKNDFEHFRETNKDICGFGLKNIRFVRSINVAIICYRHNRQNERSINANHHKFRQKGAKKA